MENNVVYLFEDKHDQVNINHEDEARRISFNFYLRKKNVLFDLHD